MAEPAKGRTKMEVGEDSVAIITICIPLVISLSIYGMAAAGTAFALYFGLGCLPGSSFACPDRCPIDLGSDPGVTPFLTPSQLRHPHVHGFYPCGCARECSFRLI
ncbi:hypothetical protein E2562_036654 [Oryza meyeriana var. granulata]|uniref:Uncharacterized protein n=1 Tax=Oryza meyeriana var. granulata TaxID=110450 RepID=A0A6G1FGI8_9ORYZ|nr:hypothetical protein E2562_036654 [Oryza meyeriana var. granulata]